MLVSQPVCLTVSQSVCQSVSLFVSQSVSLTDNQSGQAASRSVSQSVNQSVRQSVSRSVSQSVSRSITHSVSELASDSFIQSLITSVSQWLSQLVNQSVSREHYCSFVSTLCARPNRPKPRPHCRSESDTRLSQLFVGMFNIRYQHSEGRTNWHLELINIYQHVCLLHVGKLILTSHKLSHTTDLLPERLWYWELQQGSGRVVQTRQRQFHSTS
jgi:hypothetical protein